MRTLPMFGLIAVAAAGVVGASPIAAQQHAGHSTSPAVVGALLRDIETAEQKLVGLAEAIPEESYDWRPAEGVRSVREVMLHVAADNYFIPTIVGAAAPAASGITAGDFPSVQAFEARAADKAEVVRQLRDSFAHLRKVMAGVDESRLGDTMNLFGQQATALDLWVLTATHLHEHLGQAIAYARSNGVVPPWSM